MKASLPKISLLYLKETFPEITNEPLMNQRHARRAMDGLTAIYKHLETPELSRINYGHKLPITATDYYEGFLAKNESSLPKRNVSKDHQ